jgi:hypothetical protein
MRQNHGLLNDSACESLMKPGIMDREELVRTALHFSDAANVS